MNARRLLGWGDLEDRRRRQARSGLALGATMSSMRLACNHGLLQRYLGGCDVDRLPAGEGSFLICSFWLVDAWVLLGRRDDARALYERLLALCNDVGLLAEQYDPERRRMLGNDREVRYRPLA